MFWTLCEGILFHLDLHDLAPAAEYFTISPFTYVRNFGTGKFSFSDTYLYLKQNKTITMLTGIIKKQCYEAVNLRKCLKLWGYL